MLHCASVASGIWSCSCTQEVSLYSARHGEFIVASVSWCLYLHVVYLLCAGGIVTPSCKMRVRETLVSFW